MINPGLIHILEVVSKACDKPRSDPDQPMRVASFGKPSLLLPEAYAKKHSLSKSGKQLNAREKGFLDSLKVQSGDQFQSFDPQSLLTNCFKRPTRIEIIDADPQEEASLCWDLNYFIPSVWHNKFDLVLDSGTHEHVFNIGTSLLSAANLPGQGGLIIGALPLYSPNHGFYNINPICIAELFCPTNGYELLSLVVQTYESPWHSLRGSAKKRLVLSELRHHAESYDQFLLSIQSTRIKPDNLSRFNTLYYAAKRCHIVPITPPQQRKYKN